MNPTSQLFPNRKPQSSVQLLWLVQWFWSTVFLGALIVPIQIALGSRSTIPPLWIAIVYGLFAVWCLVRLILIPFQYKVYRFSINENFVTVQSGVFVRTVRTVPVPRIQYVDVSASATERLLGIATLSVHSAGATSAAISIHGVSQADAETIRNQILTWTGVSGGL